jgi:hypothetical protein
VGTSRSTTRRIFGNGPLLQSSKRIKEVSWPGTQRSSLKAPPPASLVFIHSIAHGSLSLAWLRASLELNTAGTTTARSGRVSLSLRRKSMRIVWSSRTTNCSGFCKLPAAIWNVGKPPTVTARSRDHLTSSAVTGAPSWKVALRRSLKVTDMPSGETLKSSASSGSILV